MRFQLMSDWPVEAWCVPVGTILDCEIAETGEIVRAPLWNGNALPLPIPMNAMALDQDAADGLSRSYPQHLYLLHCVPGCENPR